MTDYIIKQGCDNDNYGYGLVGFAKQTFDGADHAILLKKLKVLDSLCLDRRAPISIFSELQKRAIRLISRSRLKIG